MIALKAAIKLLPSGVLLVSLLQLLLNILLMAPLMPLDLGDCALAGGESTCCGEGSRSCVLIAGAMLLLLLPPLLLLTLLSVKLFVKNSGAAGVAGLDTLPAGPAPNLGGAGFVQPS